MGSVLSYSLYSSILLALLYLTYKWMMAGENQHRYNRAALWIIYAVALFALPVGNRLSGLTASVPVPMPLAEIDMADLMAGMDEVVIAEVPHQPIWLTILLWVYLGGVVFTIGQTLWVGMRLRRIITRGEEVGRYGNKVVIVTDDEGIAPFSWCRYVVMNRADWNENGDMILVHELQHLGLRHWIDLLVAQFVGIFQWYNPAAWLMREELKTVHEYQADSAVLASGVCARDYQMLLIKKAVGARFPSLANSLNHSKLKKRITMMYNQKSPASRRLRGLALVPALGVALAVANLDAVASVLADTSDATMIETPVETLPDVPVESPQLEEIVVVSYKSNENSSDSQTASPAAESRESMKPVTGSADALLADGGQVYKKVEKMPQYPGGEVELMKYVATNIRYPEAAAKAQTQGRVIAQFVVQKDGSIGDVNVIRSVSPECDAEAERVIKSLPKFTPGTVGGKPVAVWYTIPITFRLTSGSSKTAEVTSSAAPSAPSAVNDATAQSGDQVFSVVEVKPQFPGGEAALLKYVGEHLNYPKEAYEKGTQGRVVVQFVVKSDGAIGQVKVIRSVDPLLDAEAKRVISSLPKFTPGMLGGKPVSVWYTLPVTFRIKGNKDEEQKAAPVEKPATQAPLALNGKAKSVIQLKTDDSAKAKDVDVKSMAIYLNDRNVTSGGEAFLEQIDPSRIDSISVRKSDPRPTIHIYVNKEYAETMSRV
ncbi:M56 family metallopeptidase [uncultured Duncaniella sp.]|uniref:M56 family metallopeptidase n=1 Tax=uncultured Duncaniella sp. TaxID=2768039 RepID=UPI0025E65C95|nr:M56 family metallopeptidase [uncultured Duncaniella sp.]